jgi:predicted phosphodiesterase
MQSMRIGLIADTHGFLDETLFSYFSQRDEVWHAGDFGSVKVLKRLRQFKPVRGVHWTCGGPSVYMTHVGGYPGRYDPRAKRIVLDTKPSLFACGHSHSLKVMRDLNPNLIHMNPGACGNAGFHQVRTGLRLTVAAGKIIGVEAIEFGRRGR